MKTWFWILGWSLSILTITGNGFIIFLVCSKRLLRTKTNAFVVSLAVADFCVGMTAVPSLFLCEMVSDCIRPGTWLSWVHYIRWPFTLASGTNLCCLVFDRYIAVVKPLKYLTFMTLRRVIQMVFASWAIAVGLFIFYIVSFILSIRLLSVIFFWLALIFFQLIPCFLLVFCFASMLFIVCKHDQVARTLAKQLRFNHQVLYRSHDKSAFQMMAVVIAVFLLCYAILLRCTILSILNRLKECNDTDYRVPMLVLNSVINPVAYAFYKRDIKKEIKKRICCTTRKQRNNIEPRYEA